MLGGDLTLCEIVRRQTRVKHSFPLGPSIWKRRGENLGDQRHESLQPSPPSRAVHISRWFGRSIEDLDLLGRVRCHDLAKPLDFSLQNLEDPDRCIPTNTGLISAAFDAYTCHGLRE